MTIREMIPEDQASILEIYRQGIDSGLATFRTACPSWEEWNSGHKNVCRFVAADQDLIIGFAAVSPVSSLSHYSGVWEVMVYVHEAHRHCGAGTMLMRRLMEEAPKHGCWTLYSSIMSENAQSIRLHEKCGFRTVGYRERIAKDRYGNWKDTTIMEYRFPDKEIAR